MPATPSLTIGMACYDDFDGVWFTVKSLQLYHAELMESAEILVVDNNPSSDHGREVRRFIGGLPNGRYIEHADTIGTAQPRNRVFEEAAGENVLCLDCHVMLEPGSVRRLVDFFGSHPGCRDLLQGPIVGDRGRVLATHQALEWRRQALGVWDIDERGLNPDAESFEIPQQGMGCFACRKDAWPGFHADFRGFGGCETYAAESFRRRCDRVLCLPFLRWHHRFPRPNGVPHRLNAHDQLRNYLITAREFGWDRDEVIEGYCRDCDAETKTRLLKRLSAPDCDGAREHVPPERPASVCSHESLAASVDFRRNVANGKVTAIHGDLVVECSACGFRFELAGAPSNHIVLDVSNLNATPEDNHKTLDEVFAYANYDEYVAKQRDYSLARKHITVSRRSATTKAAKMLKSRYPGLRSVICIGARDPSEVECFLDVGFEAVGIDLHEAEHIIACDMAKIPEHSQLRNRRFDIAFCSHSLEHCFDFAGFYRGLNRLDVKVLHAESPLLSRTDPRECHRYEFMTRNDPVSALHRSFPDFAVDHLSYKGQQIVFTLRRMDHNFIPGR